MPVWSYSIRVVDEERTARAMAWDSPISLKEAYEVFKILRGMKLKDAEKFLEEVISKKTPIPYIRYKLGIAHKKGLARKFPKWRSPIGRYPVKTAREILKLLKNVENNASGKDLDVDKLVIIHAAAHKGRYLMRRVPRAFGRSAPRVRASVNMEVIVQEV